LNLKTGHEIAFNNLRFSSISLTEEGYIAAATLGQGIYTLRENGQWHCIGEGLPENTITYRLKNLNHTLFAATDKGLFYYCDNRWHKTEIQIPCYDVVYQDVYLTASTEAGLLCEISGKWMNIAYPEWITYQLFITPEFLFLGCQHGIAMYDCLTGLWQEFFLHTAVTGMAVYRKRLIGVTKHGKLVVGNLKGGFVETGFEDLFIYSLIQDQGDVYICTNRGLYRFYEFKNNLIIRSVAVGYAVTDIEMTETHILMATLQYGIRKMERTK